LNSSCHQAYSIRQLCPFQGLVQIVRGDYARALSGDGQHWQIQVSCEVHQQEWGIMNSPEIQRRYVMYGMWSLQNGLATLPLDPTLDVPSEQQIQHGLVDHLKSCVEQLPFPQQDHYELWALDTEQQPLALLSSAIDQHSLQHIEVRRWRALGDRSEHFQPQRAHITSDPTLKLERLIHGHTRSPLQAQWYLRNPDGSARDLQGTPVATDRFPSLLICEHWEDENMQLLCEDYHNWLAPRLLMLQNLDDATRERLELAATQRALEASRFHRLYPKIINTKAINRILVEARLRKSTHSPG
jgi:hypothetical protein